MGTSLLSSWSEGGEMSDIPTSREPANGPDATPARPESRGDSASRGQWAIGYLRLLAILSLVGGLILGVVIIAGQNCDESFLGSSGCDSSATVIGIIAIFG